MNFFKEKSQGTTNFISIYYLEYNEDEEDMKEIAGLLLKREKIEIAGIGTMDYFLFYSFQIYFPLF